MKITEIVLVSENWKGTETNFLTDLRGFMEMVIKACDDSAVDMADAVEQLYGTRTGSSGWSDLYFTGNKSVHAAFCTGEAQLRGFLMGYLNDGEWSFDVERCAKDCLEVLHIYNMKTDGRPEFPYFQYEDVEHSFHAGEILHNLNGNDYRVLTVLSPQNLLLMSLTDSQIIVGRGVHLYERYPQGKRPEGDSIVTGIEWDHGVYFGTDITKIDFDILKQEYGEPAWAENVSDLRDEIRRDFWMQKNVELKQGLPQRVRNVAKDCLEELFGTSEQNVFDTMLDKGMYDGMYLTKEGLKTISGQSR